MARMRHTLNSLIAYHGCDRSVAEAVLAGKIQLSPSVNEYDWLGSGVYFWVDSAERGLDWARALANRNEGIDDPYVIGAFIHPGLCLNLTDYGVMPELLGAYQSLESTWVANGMRVPENTAYKDGVFLYRKLDCAVINATHQFRADAGNSHYDCVYGVFEEGGELYPGAAFRTKTHIQIAVRNPECIVGYFRVRELE